MSDFLWRFAMLAIVGLFLWILHRYIGAYPAALPRSEQPSVNIRAALSLAGIAISLSVLKVLWISPWLERAIGQRKAILWGVILFGLTHVMLDISALLETEGILAVLSALLLQTLAG